MTGEPATNTFIFMATTVHIPTQLLARVDQRAKALGVSRNRLIVETLEASLHVKRGWPPELLRMLEKPLDEASARELDDTMAEVRRRRVNRRGAPAL